MMDDGEKSAGPKPNCQTMLPLWSTSMTRLLNWSAIRVFCLELNLLSCAVAKRQPPIKIPRTHADCSSLDSSLINAPRKMESPRYLRKQPCSPPMPTSLLALFVTLRSIIRSRADLQVENLALRAN